jgi:hypothetical protein
MSKRKLLNIVSLVLGILSILMIFVFPFFIPNEWANSKYIGGIYFITFLTFLAIANRAGELTNKPLTPDEKRDEKIDQILK